MPRRVIDFDALWASDKLASCAEWAQCEYAWLYGLADASGSFEMGNLRVIWGRVAAVRKNLTLERLGEIFDEFIARGLLLPGRRKESGTGTGRAAMCRGDCRLPRGACVWKSSRRRCRARLWRLIAPDLAAAGKASSWVRMRARPHQCARLRRLRPLRWAARLSRARVRRMDKRAGSRRGLRSLKHRIGIWI